MLLLWNKRHIKIILTLKLIVNKMLSFCNDRFVKKIPRTQISLDNLDLVDNFVSFSYYMVEKTMY